MTDKSSDLPPWESPDAAKTRPDWRDVSSEVVFSNPWIEVSRRDVIAPTGNPAHYGLVRFKNRAIAVLPLHDDGTVPLVGQMRYPLGNFSWEIPEGGSPEGESAVAGAKRELLEETGLVANEMYQILEMELSNSVTDEVAVCFLATGLSQQEAAPDDTERFEYARVPFPQVLEAVIKGQVRDALTVACVLRVHHMAVKGELPPHLCTAVLGGQ
ncbi:MAG TPA: NUDIX hydrolase [Asticcacaulis sp.]|nr:NUDIX hydrolase [Asticcacaulis sp.]